MTTSIRNQITARVFALMQATPPGGGGVFRSRETALARNESPATIVYPVEEDTDAFGDDQDKSSFILALEFAVRGDPWDDLADQLAFAAHPLIINDSVLLGLCARIRRDSARWEAKEADATAGVLAQTYRFIYLSPIGSL